MKNNIKAEIVAHSKRANTGEEIITYKLTFPRIILSEVNTYKQIEKNTSSSRAIPFEKMVETVENDPFIPLAWQISHKGMQGNKYYTDPDIIECKTKRWLEARDAAILAAKNMDIDIISTKKPVFRDIRDIIEGDNYEVVSGEFINPVTKQLKNRILEPWMWVCQLVTGTKESFQHLFEQRCPQYEFYFGKFKSKKEVLEYLNIGEIEYPKPFPKTDLDWFKCNKGQAEIHFMDLAEKMYDALNESTPDILKEGDFHVPFLKDIIHQLGVSYMSLQDAIRMSVCLTAKVSYTKIGDGNTITIEKAREMYDRLKNSQHWSCFGHIAKCMTNDEYNNWVKGKTYQDSSDYRTIIPEETKGYNKNLRGFISLRQYVEDNIELKDI